MNCEPKRHTYPHTPGCDGYEPPIQRWLEQVIAKTGEVRISRGYIHRMFHICAGRDGVGPNGENWCRQDDNIELALESILREGPR